MKITRRLPGVTNSAGIQHVSFILGLCGLALVLTQPASAQDAGPRFTLVEAARTTLAEEGAKDKRFNNSVGSLAFAPDGSTLAVGMRDPDLILLLDPATLAIRARLEGHLGLVLRLVFSPDGKTLASAGLDGEVRVWDVARKRETFMIDLYKDIQIQGSKAIQGLVISPDGQRLYTGQRTFPLSQSTFAWDLKDGRLLDKQIEYQSPIQCLQVSPDGLTLATTSRILSDTLNDQSIRLWDLATSKLKARFDPKGAYSNHVEFTPDGKSLAAVFDDKTLRLFDTATLTEKYQVKSDGPTRYLYLTMAPDGATLATADNTRLQLRKTADGVPIATIPDVGGRITSIQFAPDGRTIVVGGSAGLIRVYRLDPMPVQ